MHRQYPHRRQYDQRCFTASFHKAGFKFFGQRKVDDEYVLQGWITCEVYIDELSELSIKAFTTLCAGHLGHLKLGDHTCGKPASRGKQSIINRMSQRAKFRSFLKITVFAHTQAA